jgi:uncharacterized protein (DUF488 family)
MSTQPHRIFTIGFAGKSAEQFFTILKDAGVQRVLDVRLYNSSQLAGYTKSSDLPFFLRSIVGAGYIHLPAFAPTKQLLNGYKKGEFTWAEYEREYAAILDRRQPQRDLRPEDIDGGCLLCAEPTADQCHRRLAAEYLQRMWPTLAVTHL